MAFDHKAFATQLGMSAEDQVALDALFGKYPDAPTKIESLLSTQIETALAPAKADLAKKEADLNAQFETLSSLRGADSATLDAAKKRAEDAAVALTRAQERIKALATDYGLNPDDYLKDLGAPVVTKPPVDTSMASSFDPKELLAQAGRNAWNALRESAHLSDIARKHERLYGKPLDNTVDLLDKLQEAVKRTGNPNLTLDEIWRREYKVDERENELREADVQKRIEEAVAKDRTARADAVALGTSHNVLPAEGFRSPIFTTLDKEKKLPEAARVNQNVLAFAKTFREELEKRTKSA